MEDKEIIKRLQSGQMNAADILIERYKDSHYKFCYHLANNQHDADDLFQEAWVKAIKNIQKFNVNTKFATWLYSITLNTYKDRYRKAKRWLKRVNLYFSNDTMELELKNIKSSDPVMDEKLIDEEQKHYLQKCINRLNDTYRIPIMLFYFKNLSYDQIAQILQIPVGTVKSRLNEGKRKLKKMMEVVENG